MFALLIAIALNDSSQKGNWALYERKAFKKAFKSPSLLFLIFPLN